MCIPWRGTSRTDTWKPHQAETSSSCLWNMKLGAREKTNSKQNTKLRCTIIKQELLVYSHIPPHLARSILSPVLTFPPPCESRDQSPALWMDTLSCTSKARLPQTPPQTLWSRPNGISHFANHTCVVQSSSSEEMLMWKHSQPEQRHSEVWARPWNTISRSVGLGAVINTS